MVARFRFTNSFLVNGLCGGLEVFKHGRQTDCWVGDMGVATLTLFRTTGDSRLLGLRRCELCLYQGLWAGTAVELSKFGPIRSIPAR